MTPADLQLAGIVNSGSILSKIVDKLTPSAPVGPGGSFSTSNDKYYKDIAAHTSANVQAVMNGQNPVYPNYLFDPAFDYGGIGGNPSGVFGEVAVNNSPFKYGVENSNNPYDKTIQMLRNLQAENNSWSAAQAQKQMDFQLMMSNTAHQREVADLKAAGLNPVLSAGGNGAAVTSGAMAQADTSGTSAIANIAMAAIQGMQNTAIGVSGSSGSGGVFNNPYVKRFLSTAAGALAGKVVKALF